MEIIILLLQLLLAFFIGVPVSVSSSGPLPVEPVVIEAPAQAAPTTVPGGDEQAAEPQMRVLAVVESVDALLMESFPVQITLQVSGYHPDGCDATVEVTQRRDGNQVFVEVYRVLPAAVMCPMVLRPLDETVRLEGGFEPGTYSIDVNGVVIEVTI